MKKLLALAIVALMAGGAFAQAGMGLFSSDTDFSDATTNFDVTGAFTAYLVLINAEPTWTTIGGYECGITCDNAGFFVSEATGPNGWLNVGGSGTNHAVGYGTPLPIGDNHSVVLSTLQCGYYIPTPATISFGPSDPSSGRDLDPQWFGPMLANGSNPDELAMCFCAGGVSPVGPVATLNGAGVTPATESSWSGVKDLFN